MTTDFKKIKGMSWVLSKKASDLTEEQRVYQKALRAFNYQTRKKKDPKKVVEYNHNYNSQYYQRNKERIRQNQKLYREKTSTGRPVGRPNLSGIKVNDDRENWEAFVRIKAGIEKLI